MTHDCYSASPSSPAYVSAPSPYAHPLPPSTQPSPATFPVPLPPPLRVASAAGKGRGAAANRMSPANPTTAQKRAAQTTDDAAPRSRKKPKAAVAKEPPLPDINTNGIDVTRYDNPDSVSLEFFSRTPSIFFVLTLFPFWSSKLLCHFGRLSRRRWDHLTYLAIR